MACGYSPDRAVKSEMQQLLASPLESRMCLVEPTNQIADKLERLSWDMEMFAPNVIGIHKQS